MTISLLSCRCCSSLHACILLLLLWTCLHFASSFVTELSPKLHALGHRSSPPRLFYTREDSEPLPMSASDMGRLKELQSRKMTIPLVIMDSLLPGQHLFFQSPDPKFGELLNYALKSKHSNEIGIVGLNPHDGMPLTLGVTSIVQHQDVTFGINRESEKVMAARFKGQRRFIVDGAPWMDESKSFWLANVEIVRDVVVNDNNDDDDAAAASALDRTIKTQHLHQALPELLEAWTKAVLEHGKATPAILHTLMGDLGKMPKKSGERAIWVAALMNPTALPDSMKWCVEIRPAMLACRNDHDRLLLATTALQSSMDHVTGKQNMF